jgi:hypothetical protein
MGVGSAGDYAVRAARFDNMGLFSQGEPQKRSQAPLFPV